MKKNFFARIIAIALVAMSLVAVAIPAFADHPYYYVKVTPGTTLNVRNGVGTDYKVIKKLKYGTFVKSLHHYQPANDYAWDEIVTQDGSSIQGYVQSRFLSLTKPDDEWIVRYGGPSLKYAPSDYNTYVVNLQRDLYDAGYTSVGNADGKFGDKTRTAVKNFQRNNSLTADGIVGDKTKKALWQKLH